MEDAERCSNYISHWCAWDIDKLKEFNKWIGKVGTIVNVGLVQKTALLGTALEEGDRYVKQTQVASSGNALATPVRITASVHPSAMNKRLYC